MAGTGKCSYSKLEVNAWEGRNGIPFRLRERVRYSTWWQEILTQVKHTHTQEPEVYPLPRKLQPKQKKLCLIECEKFHCDTKCAASPPHQVHFDPSVPDEEEPPPLRCRMATANDIPATIPSHIVTVEATIEGMEGKEAVLTPPPNCCGDVSDMKTAPTQQTATTVNMLDSYSTTMALPSARSPGSTKTSQFSESTAAGYLPSHTTNSGSVMLPTELLAWMNLRESYCRHLFLWPRTTVSPFPAEILRLKLMEPMTFMICRLCQWLPNLSPETTQHHQTSWLFKSYNISHHNSSFFSSQCVHLSVLCYDEYFWLSYPNPIHCFMRFFFYYSPLGCVCSRVWDFIFFRNGTGYYFEFCIVCTSLCWWHQCSSLLDLHESWFDHFLIPEKS